MEIDSIAKQGELRSNATSELPLGCTTTDLTTDLIEFEVMALNWDDLMSTGDTIAFTFTNPPLSKILELQMSNNEKMVFVCETSRRPKKNYWYEIIGNGLRNQFHRVRLSLNRTSRKTGLNVFKSV